MWADRPDAVLLKCGCVAHAVRTHSGGQRLDPPVPSCVVHDCTEQVEKPSLEGRTATCAYGGKEVPSHYGLPFFRHRPDRPQDEYYCGCYGWD